MTDIKIRLNEIISPKQIKYKQRGPIHILNNSIKRSTIFGQTSYNHEPLTYDCKLPKLEMSRKGISYMLKYLLNKEVMNLPDRNLVRRILLDTFDEDFILSGSKEFVKHIKMMEGAQGESINPQQKLFYMILKGEVTVKNSQLQYQRREGQTFGELQILSQQNIQKISFNKNTLMVTLQEQEFNYYFYDKFNSRFLCRYNSLSTLHQLLDKIPLICKYMFLSKLHKQNYQLGEKIVDSGQTVQKIYIVGDKLRQQGLKYLIKGCIGLYQLKKGKQHYQQTVYSPTSNLQIMFVKPQYFKLFILKFSNHEQQFNNNSFLQKSQVQTTISAVNPQASEKKFNFLRMKKVKLSPQKRAKTESSFAIDNNFKFLKLDNPAFDIVNCNKIDTIRQKRDNKSKNSFFVRPNQKSSYFK